ncbi:hypothetical protein [Cyanobium sp. Morenito 9A2]|uniref:hypothetical protein n=1 Tax=Cyanobium sp. Morenito 9A2 TaxID=2823718 RepID=UPI0020CC8788|nr:hypothetical protein [Cyanobium sp. Morenito 9A2]MCP9850149.1 hypothetical protein [Cyanobium sp. Morenito 9A2]
MLIYACVSAHGFGHGSRTASVLTALRGLRPDWRLVVSTTLPRAFLVTALEEAQGLPAGAAIEIRPCRWDVGVVQADALGADGPATLAALENLDEELGATVAAEAAWLRLQQEPVLVLADVPPAAARLARSLGAPLAWLGNFGWEAIYGAMGPAFAPWAASALALYRQGDLLLHCPLAMPMDWHLPTLMLGLTCGRPQLEAEVLRHRLGLPDEPERCVLVSFGGLGFPLDPQRFAAWGDHQFVVTDPRFNPEESPSNVRALPAEVRPLELMPLCGRMITKPGYSSFCEALSQGVGLHVVHREGFAEAAVLEQALARHGRHRLLSQSQLQAGDWQLDQPLLPPSGPPLAMDGAQQAAEALVALACGRSAGLIGTGTVDLSRH